MSQNTNITALDAAQVIQRVFDVADDAIRINGSISVSNPSVGTNGATAPTSSSQGGGVGPDGNLHPVSTDNSGNQNVNVISSVIPTGAATASNQTIELSRLSGSLVPTAYNEIDLAYYSSGSGIGQIQTATFKLASATVKVINITYDSNGNISTVVAS